MPHLLSLAINTVGLFSNIYALKNVNKPPFENPAFLDFGGRYQFLTILGLTIATIAFALKVIRYFVPQFTPVIYAIVTNIATPMEGLISVLYWTMMFVDPYLLMPEDSPGIPLLLDLMLHLFPALFLWIDFLVFDIEFKRSNAHVGIIAVFSVFYFFWSWYCQSKNGYWVYPFLATFSLSMRVGFFVASGTLCWCMYEIGAKLHSKIHHKVTPAAPLSSSVLEGKKDD